jgi:AcrR family transcriptional regulator
MDENLIISLPEKKERADALRNRRLLLDTALRLFQQQGVANVTMSEIAQAAQVGKGTLYRHFTDKGELIMALLDSDMHDLQDRVFAYLRRACTPREKLRWFLETVGRYIIAHMALLDPQDGRPNVFLTHPAHYWWRHTIRGLLAQIPECGDPEAVSDLLYILLDVHAIRYQIDAQGRTEEAVVQRLRLAADRLVG